MRPASLSLSIFCAMAGFCMCSCRAVGSFCICSRIILMAGSLRGGGGERIFYYWSTGKERITGWPKGPHHLTFSPPRPNVYLAKHVETIIKLHRWQLVQSLGFIARVPTTTWRGTHSHNLLYLRIGHGPLPHLLRVSAHPGNGTALVSCNDRWSTHATVGFFSFSFFLLLKR